MTADQRDRRWVCHVTDRVDTLVREAARLTGQPMSAFVEESAVVRAESVIAEHRAVRLSPDELSRFVDVLDEAPMAIPVLIDLFSRPSQIPPA